MDPELKKGFQELQAQVIESRSKIANIESHEKVIAHETKINDSLIEQFTKDGDLNDKYIYQPVGRMLVKQQGKDAEEFLLARQIIFQERLKQFKEVKEVCTKRVKESETSLRDLVNKKRNQVEKCQA